MRKSERKMFCNGSLAYPLSSVRGRRGRRAGHGELAGIVLRGRFAGRGEFAGTGLRRAVCRTWRVCRDRPAPGGLRDVASLSGFGRPGRDACGSPVGDRAGGIRKKSGPRKTGAELGTLRRSDYFTFGPAATRLLPSSLPVNFVKFFTKRFARSSALVSHSLASL